tara:strand:+ start:658 stop:1257 length:600 start_codon:yes stop_codon:yes gene_type:complete
MSDQRAEKEPSMEEILASIRQIISEDGQKVVAPPTDNMNLMAGSKPNSLDALEQETRVFEDVLELTDEVKDDGTVVNLKTGENLGDKGLEEGEDKDEVIKEQTGTQSTEPLESKAVRVFTNRLVSDLGKRESLSNNSGFDVTARSKSKNPNLGIEAKTVEDLVKEVLRPIIKEWLDANLDSLVERLLKTEIKRLNDEAQ